MHHDQLIIKGANEHNIKCIDVTIPRDQLGGDYRSVRFGISKYIHHK
jgi:excinuclease UvrABC ATPase subunit